MASPVMTLLFMLSVNVMLLPVFFFLLSFPLPSRELDEELRRRRVAQQQQGGNFDNLVIYYPADEFFDLVARDLGRVEEGKRRRPRSSAFFLVDGRVDSKQACAFESAAAADPDRTVYVLHDAKSLKVVERFPRILSTIPNLKFVKVDFRELVKGSNVKHIWDSDYEFSVASHPFRFHLLDLLGGTYLDTDVISLDRMAPDVGDAVVLQAEGTVGSHYLRLGQNSTFAKLAIERELEYLSENPRPAEEKWADPLLTSAASALCDREGDGSLDVPDAAERGLGLAGRHCGSSFRVLTPRVANPIPHWEWKTFYLPGYANVVLSSASESYALKYWSAARSSVESSDSDKEEYLMTADQPIYKVFREACPQVEEHLLRHLLDLPWSQKEEEQEKEGDDYYIGETTKPSESEQQ